MTEKEIETFIEYMANAFINCYNKLYKSRTYQEDTGILGDGYCFYFAHLLNQLIPDFQIVLTQYPFAHYLICYHDQFYDYRGLIPKDKNSLFVDFDDPTPLSRLIFATDVELEWGYAEINGTTDQKRDAIYNSIMNELLQVGRSYLEEHHLLEPKMTL